LPTERWKPRGRLWPLCLTPVRPVDLVRRPEGPQLAPRRRGVEAATGTANPTTKTALGCGVRRALVDRGHRALVSVVPLRVVESAIVGAKVRFERAAGAEPLMPVGVARPRLVRAVRIEGPASAMPRSAVAVRLMVGVGELPMNRAEPGGSAACVGLPGVTTGRVAVNASGLAATGRRGRDPARVEGCAATVRRGRGRRRVVGCVQTGVRRVGATAALSGEEQSAAPVSTSSVGHGPRRRHVSAVVSWVAWRRRQPGGLSSVTFPQRRCGVATPPLPSEAAPTHE